MHGDDVEAIAATARIVLIGVVLAAAYGLSAWHIGEVAARHGQEGPRAIVLALLPELVAVIALLSWRTSRVWATVVLVVSVAFSLAANLATADGTPWGYAVSGAPAVAFLLVLPLAHRRAPAAPEPVAAPAPAPGRRTVRTAPAVAAAVAPAAPVVTEPVHRRSAPRQRSPHRPVAPSVRDLAALLPEANRVLDQDPRASSSQRAFIAAWKADPHTGSLSTDRGRALYELAMEGRR